MALVEWCSFSLFSGKGIGVLNVVDTRGIDCGENSDRSEEGVSSSVVELNELAGDGIRDDVTNSGASRP